MSKATVKRIIWLSTQSPRLENSDLNPTRNTVGYGYLEDTESGQEIFFDPKSLGDVSFSLIREGQPVEYVPDGTALAAKSVTLVEQGTSPDRRHQVAEPR